MAKLTAKTYSQQGKEVGSSDLNPSIFGIEVRVDLIHTAVVAQRANSRYNFAHTKQRGEVRGGGKKPWKQKGTGRARHGSSRSPIWVGGAVTFGPTNKRNFSKGINKKTRRKAMFMGLSDKVIDEKLILLEKLQLTAAKTKDLNNVLLSLPCKSAKILLVIDKKDEKVVKSAGNLKNVRVILADSLNIYDIVNAEFIVMTQESLPVLDKTYIEKTTTEKIEKVAKKVKVKKEAVVKEKKETVKSDKKASVKKEEPTKSEKVNKK